VSIPCSTARLLDCSTARLLDGPEMMHMHLRDEFERLLHIGAVDEAQVNEANRRGHEASFVENRTAPPTAQVEAERSFRRSTGVVSTPSQPSTRITPRGPNRRSGGKPLRICRKRAKVAGGCPETGSKLKTEF
jgi:hypothetical protein